MPGILEKNRTSQLTIEAEKNEVAIKLLSIKDKAVVHTIHLIVDDLTASNSKRTSVAQYNKEIEAAVKRVRGGESVSNDEVMKQMDKW